ncbi:HAD-IC family P-type ATPase [Patescibacteria group bacterium]|nr:HAD-IC family P-type ATPase [Patescibacteria group bacterium]
MSDGKKQKPWHSLSANDVLKEFSSSPRGLGYGEVELRLEKYGQNVFKYEEKFRLLKIIWNQIKSPLVFILIIAGFVTLFLKAYTDSVVILVAVTINTIIGVVQEGKASQAFSKLRDSQKKYTTVIRENRKQLISAENVVPGDILVLSAGDQVAADARILESKGLEVNEAVLTGEWMSNLKNSRKIKEEVPLADRSNMVWMSTLITDGWGTAIIVGTGFDTEIGKIAQMLGEEKAPLTNFQKSIKKLANVIGLIVLGTLVIIFAVGVLHNQPISQMFLASVAIAVAAVPEGLPVVVSVVLAIGMERILSNGGLIKRLSAVETLGSVDVILTDKTGTLTQAIMRVSDIVTLNSLEQKQKKDDKSKILEMAILASSGFVENPDDNLADWIVRGHPMDQALILAGAEQNIHQHTLLKEMPRLDFLEFDAERRFAASLHDTKGKENRIFITGAPELLLDLSKTIYKSGKAVKLTKKYKELLTSVLEKQTSFGERVIVVAYKNYAKKEFPRNDGDGAFEDFIFGGFILFHDPLRPDAASSFKKAKLAGIKTIMVTGDHKKTAQKIGEEVGIFKKGDRIITGDMMEELTDEDLKKELDRVSIFARVLPHQKLRIVKFWQEAGKTVAMTGDGVNDAPSLKRAEVGVALNSGTEVAKEASSMILLNNNFSVIISAIGEGRKILVNFRKILVYLLSTAFSEILLVFVSLVIGAPLPILPAQVLWANLVEEGFMNFAFAFEPGEDGIMEVPPKSFSFDKILTNEGRNMIIILAFFTSFLLMVVFLLSHFVFKHSLDYTRTIVFAVLSADSIFFAFSLKNFKKPLWQINIFSNRYLIVALFVSMLFLAAALFLPPIRALLSLEKLGIFDIFIVLSLGVLNLFIIEVAKHFLVNREIKK